MKNINEEEKKCMFCKKRLTHHEKLMYVVVVESAQKIHSLQQQLEYLV